jgi:predicted transcriptional regulator
MTVSITDAELALMQVLWKQSPLTAREITERLQTEKDWHRKTVNTLLSRLEKKAAVRVAKDRGDVKRFSPLIEKQAYARMATSQFVDQLFDGDIAPLVASFAGSRRLDSAQISELQGLLEALSDDD